MPKQTLNLEALDVQTFEAGPVPAGDVAPDAFPTGSRCSAVDACPTRLCATSLC